MGSKYKSKVMTLKLTLASEEVDEEVVIDEILAMVSDVYMVAHIETRIENIALPCDEKCEGCKCE